MAVSSGTVVVFCEVSRSARGQTKTAVRTYFDSSDGHEGTEWKTTSSRVIIPHGGFSRLAFILGIPSGKTRPKYCQLQRRQSAAILFTNTSFKRAAAAVHSLPECRLELLVFGHRCAMADVTMARWRDDTISHHTGITTSRCWHDGLLMLSFFCLKVAVSVFIMLCLV